MELKKFAFAAMASECEVCIDGLEASRAADLAVAVEAEVRRIERKYSRFRTVGSVIATINNNAYASSVPVDKETSSLLAYADRLYRLSGGLFDITTGALQSVWDFKAGIIPPEDVLREQLEAIGWENVVQKDGSVRFLKRDIRIDLGGIGKEYAADRAADVLLRGGVVHGYVNLGGDLRALGPKRDGNPWMIGIRHPRKPGEMIASIPLQAGGLATSGDYERYFERDGRRYCHLLKPTDGYPAAGWQSISVLAPQAITAGASATIAMLKQQDALEFLREIGLPYLAIDADGRLHSSSKNSISI